MVSNPDDLKVHSPKNFSKFSTSVPIDEKDKIFRYYKFCKHSPKFLKPNYPAYSSPMPGPGLEKYYHRLTGIICPNIHGSQEMNSGECCCHTDNFDCGCCKCCRCKRLKKFFSVFPPKYVCPREKIRHQKLSFIDDPPYVDMNQFFEYSCPKYLNHRPEFRCRKCDSVYYCRCRLPRWVQNPQRRKV